MGSNKRSFNAAVTHDDRIRNAAFSLGTFLLLALIIGIVLYYSGQALFGGTRSQVELVVYGFSTQEEAFSHLIFPAFEQNWEAKNGQDLIIEGVFGPSGTLANQILLGAPADVAILSNVRHATWLEAGQLLDQDVPAEIIGYTPMVIVTRPGNPADIKGFADLAQPGVRLLHAEPGQSGAGDWAILAEYGSSYLDGGDRATAEAQLKAIWNNVKLLGSSARATLTLFELGTGDALVTYEQDALLALDRGVPLEIVMPAHTIIAQHTAVVVSANTSSREKAAAEDFVHYLVSEKGQRMLAQYHMRPAGIDTGSFTKIIEPFTVEDLGGWPQAHHDLIEGLWQRQIAPELETRLLPKVQDGTE